MEGNEFLNMDAYILLSMLNMKLRDSYSSLDNLCYDLNIPKEKLELKLKEIEYLYESSSNQFKAF
ncbi:DUF4250 domain-containing protein [Clostridium grantii]|jgi:hypothetical protein|uniref:DUF4250 domain-containing protein n=1 Tax=Clostridium grantii DSM 8605 TaxID=1121316 RepID=A0A1M5X202_9CLOT|nr:DUF4250 domain-containing protein [Clostridium grantii]SHH93514.1 protein of unknown function [Clostridium grantii DSM 8605]